MGSFVPWLYYSFYCSPQPCFIYLIVVCTLGLAAITVSQCDFFATPQYRGVRAGRQTAAALPCRRSGDVLIFNGFFFSGVFVGLGLSGVVPTLHFVISEGLFKATTMGQMGWLLLMAALYITGACLYAARIPERFFPGKCDIWVSRSGSLFFFYCRRTLNGSLCLPFPVPLPPVVPHLGGRRSVCSFPRSVQPPGIPLHSRRGLHRGRRSLTHRWPKRLVRRA